MTRLISIAVVAVMLVAACSVPTDETVTVLDPAILPEQLRPDFIPTTTTSPPQTELYTIFLLTQRPDIEQRAVAPVQRELEQGSSLSDVLQNLFVEPTEVDEGLVSELAAGVFRLTDATSEGATAVIDILVIDPVTDEPADDQLIVRDVQRDIAAQLVWTATEYADEIRGVQILVDGQPTSWPTSGEDTDPGDTMTTNDYEIYDLEFVFPEPTTTTTAPPTTTEPGG